MLGYTELVDESTQAIKPSIIKLLGWEAHKDQLNVPDILCAYVGAVNQHVMFSVLDLLNKENDAYTALCDYVNKHYGIWVNDIFRLRRANNAAIPYRPVNHQQNIAIGMGIGAAGLLTASLIGFALFNAAKAQNPRTEPHDYRPEWKYR